jgi:2-iminobutanoate/2-iminopropanoate deaminase
MWNKPLTYKKHSMKHNKISRPAIIVFFIFLSFASFSQTDTSIIKFKNPASVAAPKGYSHAAIIDLGNCQMIILSGQVPLDSKGNLVGQGDLGKQAEQVFLNIKNILSELGGTMDNVVKLGVFMTDASQIQIFRDVRNKFVNIKAPPASTLVQVGKLFRDDVFIEVEATAIIPKK